jgi:hypothetical protein
MAAMITNTAKVLATAVAPHLYWITSRAAGIAALALASLSVCVGLLMGGQILKGHRPDLRVTHEALSLATLAALLIHGLSLLGDGYLHPSLGDVASEPVRRTSSRASAGTTTAAIIARNHVCPASVPSPRECARPSSQASAAKRCSARQRCTPM